MTTTPDESAWEDAQRQLERYVHERNEARAEREEAREYADECLGDLAALADERDEARAECERLRARVAELEATADAQRQRAKHAEAALAAVESDLDDDAMRRLRGVVNGVRLEVGQRWVRTLVEESPSLDDVIVGFDQTNDHVLTRRARAGQEDHYMPDSWYVPTFGLGHPRLRRPDEIEFSAEVASEQARELMRERLRARVAELEAAPKLDGDTVHVGCAMRGCQALSPAKPSTEDKWAGAAERVVAAAKAEREATQEAPLLAVGQRWVRTFNGVDEESISWDSAILAIEEDGDHLRARLVDRTHNVDVWYVPAFLRAHPRLRRPEELAPLGGTDPVHGTRGSR